MRRTTCQSWRLIAILGAASVFVACQSHLPALDDYPTKEALAKPVPLGQRPLKTPKVTDAVGHIQCELAKILNTTALSAAEEDTSSEFLFRLQSNPDIGSLVHDLIDYNFVATVQLSLEVTDAEGLTPSLTFMNAVMGLHTGTVGAQWTGTQDRTVTLNYAIDLSRLAPYKDELCDKISAEQTQSGIQGDLGLADIVADGLLSLDKSAPANVYAN